MSDEIPIRGGWTATRLATLGLIGPVVAATLVGALHVLPETARISPLSRTISEYGLSGAAWAFNVGVVALAVGSLAILVATVRAGLARMSSVGFALGLAGVVRCCWSSCSPSTTGRSDRARKVRSTGWPA